MAEKYEAPACRPMSLRTGCILAESGDNLVQMEELLKEKQS